MDIFLQIIGVILILFANGFFVAAEFAIVKLRSSQIDLLVRSNDKRASLLKHINGHLDAYLSATQVGITLASLALGWVGEPVTEAILAPIIGIFTSDISIVHSLSLPIGFTVLTALHIVIGELLPKSFAINYEVTVSLNVARPLHFFYLVFIYPIRFLNGVVNAILKMLGAPPLEAEGGHSAEELKSVIIESAKRGVVSRSESELIESVFAFSDTTAGAVMVHRSDVVGIDLDLEPREILRIIEGEGFSRLPVYRGSMDEITGILYVKDLLPYIGQLERLSAPSTGSREDFLKLLSRGIRSPHYVSETMRISELLPEFQRRRTHIGIVVSEHGGIEGIITLEDILEEIVGEIQDESDVPSEERDAIEIGDSLYLDPSMTVADFNERYGERYSIIEESPEYQTLSGYIQKEAGRIPSIGDVIEADGIRFIVKRKVRHRLEQIKVERITPTQ